MGTCSFPGFLFSKTKPKLTRHFKKVSIARFVSQKIYSYVAYIFVRVQTLPKKLTWHSNQGNGKLLGVFYTPMVKYATVDEI